MGYSSVSLAVQNGTIFVLNGAEVGFQAKAALELFNQVGNYVEQFDLEGNYQGEWPGWYNWPDEMVGHSKNKFSPTLTYLNLNSSHSKNILPSSLNLKLELKEQFNPISHLRSKNLKT